MAEDKNKLKNDEQLQDEQLDEVSGGFVGQVWNPGKSQSGECGRKVEVQEVI